MAATTDGEVVELSVTDGRVRRILAGREVTGGPPGHLAVAPNGRAVFFDRGRPGCWSEFTYVGGPGVAGEGAWPAPSPDGTEVAVVGGANPCRPDRMTVFQVSTGEPRQWQLDPALRGQGFSLRGPLSWSMDGTRIAVPLQARADSQVRILSLQGNGTLQGDPLSPMQREGRVLAAFFIRSSGGEALVTVESCCGSRPKRWLLSRRTVGGDLVGPEPASRRIPEPKDIQVTRSGEVTEVTRAGALLASTTLSLRKISRGYVAAARG